MLPETHYRLGDMLIRDITARMRHDGRGSRAGGGAAHGHRDRQQPSGAADRTGL